MMSLRLPIVSAASLLSHTVLVAAVALCFLSRLYTIVYRAAMDSMARSMHDRFQEAVDEVDAEMFYGALHAGQEPAWISEALQHCSLPDSEVIFAEGAEMTCAVCLGELRRDEEVGQLKRCRHVFHRACIHAWLTCCRHRSPATCPICRARLSH